MASYNPLNNSQNTVFTQNSDATNKSFFNKMLRNAATWGMNLDEQIIRNQHSIGANEDPTLVKNGLYSFFSQRAIANILSKKSVPYLDRNYPDKRRLLRDYSSKDDIKDLLNTVTYETIVYDTDKNFVRLKNISDEYSRDIKDKVQEIFHNLYYSYGFNDGRLAQDFFRTFLIDGFLSFEIIYDDKNKNIIGFAKIDSATIVPGYDEISKTPLWIQFPEDPGLRRIFLDSQIIHISYSTAELFGETSYIENLIKPYNQLKIIEQTRIMFNMANATIYQKFTIPINGLGKARAQEEIAQLIADYSDHVEWDDSLGTVSINGSKNLNYNKQLWFPEGEGGTPQMELVSPEGHNLNESDMLTWFYNKLKRASGIPFSRFDKDNGGGNVYNDAAEMTRDEVKFSNFINSLRALYKEIIVKPLRIQVLMEFPELKDDKNFLNELSIEFNSNEIFEEWKKLGNTAKKTDIINNLINLLRPDGSPYFHIDYLMESVMRLPDEEIQKNNAYWEKERAKGGQIGAAQGAEGGFGGEENFGGGGNEFGGGETPAAKENPGGPPETPPETPPAPAAEANEI